VNFRRNRDLAFRDLCDLVGPIHQTPYVSPPFLPFVPCGVYSFPAAHSEIHATTLAEEDMVLYCPLWLKIVSIRGNDARLE
jgi:hypothetical protein